MNKKKYVTRIKKATKEIGTYQKSFDQVIDALATILEERDRIHEQYTAEGSEPLVDFVTDRGQHNRKPNPLLKEWNELNGTALTYWRDLGLTPAGLKKINDEALKERKVTSLDSILSSLES